MFKKEMYVIAKKDFRKEENFDFVSSFQTERCDYLEKVWYQCLKNAYHFDDKDKALQCLNRQPKWIIDSHMVIPFVKSLFNFRLISD
jgi:hypothetical protein